MGIGVSTWWREEEGEEERGREGEREELNLKEERAREQHCLSKIRTKGILF